jgi:hypothetical protein
MAGTIFATTLVRAVTSVLTAFAAGPLIASITFASWTPAGFVIGTTAVEYLAAATVVVRRARPAMAEYTRIAGP